MSPEQLPIKKGSLEFNVVKDAYSACHGSHAICVMTEWDEFKELDFEKIYKNMAKPAFVFDGRNILPLKKLAKIGFETFGIGKPLPDHVQMDKN